jgi:hypothetical protein
LDLTKLKDWAELIGVFSLVASLIFVGLQLKQSQEIAIAEQYQVRAIYGAEHLASYVESEHLLEFTAQDLKIAYDAGGFDEAINSDFETFGANYVAFSMVMAAKAMATFDNYYFQYEQGFMEHEAWSAFRHRFKEAFRDKYIQHAFLRDPLQWRPSYRKLGYNLIAELESEEGLSGLNE